MNQITALTIQSVVGTMPTDDGKHVLVKLAQPPGIPEIMLAIPPSELLRLIDGAAKSISDANKLAGESAESKPVFPTTWFELGKSQTGTCVLSLTFGAGGTLSFVLPGMMPEQIHETLSVMLGKSNTPTPGKSSQN